MARSGEDRSISACILTSVSPAWCQVPDLLHLLHLSEQSKPFIWSHAGSILLGPAESIFAVPMLSDKKDETHRPAVVGSMINQDDQSQAQTRQSG
jgi:hypothetical protein